MADALLPEALHGTSMVTLGLAIFVAFWIAGIVKGVVGLGITTVPVGLLTALVDLQTAMALIVVPSLATNLWQAMTGGHAKMLAVRLWPFLSVAAVTIPLGALALSGEVLWLLSVLLGVVLVVYSAIGLSGFRAMITPAREVWSGPTLGAVNGILTGMTGSFVFPGVVFLQGLGWPREKLIQAMGMLFTVSTVGLIFALREREILSIELLSVSFLALVPTGFGLFIGQSIRQRLSEAQFRRTFLLALMFLGAYVAAASVL